MTSLLPTARLSCNGRAITKERKRFSFSTPSQQINVHANFNNNSEKKNILIYYSAAVISTIVGISGYVRYWRCQKIEELEFLSPSSPFIGNRDASEVLETLQRAGLMGRSGSKSVKQELDFIRKWHQDRGYKGGLVVRELTQPLFGKEGTTLWQELEELALHPTWLARRECYYLYYEIRPNGHIQQQLFCRGTTVAMDVITCLSMWMVYDDEIGCRVHWGFRNQADRILEDVQPLLNNDSRTTIEVAGHSLGGAVAYIIAAKLKKRGYANVVKVTSLASPRFLCGRLQAQLLPQDTLRVESDVDPATLLPPFGSTVGPKLLLLEDSGKLAYIPNPSSSLSWVDSFFVNFRIWELFSRVNRTHRVPHYLAHIQRSLGLEQEGQ